MESFHKPNLSLWGGFLLCARPWALRGEMGLVTDLQEGMASGREGLSHTSLKANESWELGGRDRCLLGLLGAGRDYSTVRESLRKEKAFELSLKISTHQFYLSTSGEQRQYCCITG